MSKYEPVSAEVVAALQTALGAEYGRPMPKPLKSTKLTRKLIPVIIICRRS